MTAGEHYSVSAKHGQHSAASVTINAKYLGACPAGVQPGDVEMSNGVKYSRADQERMAKQAQEAMNSPETQAAMRRAGPV